MLSILWNLCMQWLSTAPVNVWWRVCFPNQVLHWDMLVTTAQCSLHQIQHVQMCISTALICHNYACFVVRSFSQYTIGLSVPSASVLGFVSSLGQCTISFVVCFSHFAIGLVSSFSQCTRLCWFLWSARGSCISDELLLSSLAEYEHRSYLLLVSVIFFWFVVCQIMTFWIAFPSQNSQIVIPSQNS